MSTRKSNDRSRPVAGARTVHAVDEQAIDLSKSYPKLRLPPLDIEPDDDTDCDPYNRTGQFCVEALKKRPDH